MKKIQKLIQDLRIHQSQEEIASKVNASQSLISRWESGGVPSAAEIALSLVKLHRQTAAKRKEAA